MENYITFSSLLFIVMIWAAVKIKPAAIGERPNLFMDTAELPVNKKDLLEDIYAKICKVDSGVKLFLSAMALNSICNYELHGVGLLGEIKVVYGLMFFWMFSSITARNYVALKRNNFKRTPELDNEFLRAIEVLIIMLISMLLTLIIK